MKRDLGHRNVFFAQLSNPFGHWQPYRLLGPLYGLRFSRVLIHMCLRKELYARHTRQGVWFRRSLLCRLEQGGAVDFLECDCEA